MRSLYLLFIIWGNVHNEPQLLHMHKLTWCWVRNVARILLWYVFFINYGIWRCWVLCLIIFMLGNIILTWNTCYILVLMDSLSEGGVIISAITVYFCIFLQSWYLCGCRVVVNAWFLINSSAMFIVCVHEYSVLKNLLQIFNSKLRLNYHSILTKSMVQGLE